MNTFRWRRARQITQIVSTALFFILALLTYRGATFILPLDLFFRLDPLAAFGAMIAARTLLTTLLVSGVMLAVGIIFGRVWCGWLCPLGAVLDWFSPKTFRISETRKSWKRIKYILLIVILVAAFLGNLSLLIFDPITLLNRTFSAALLPALNVVLASAESLLYTTPLAPAVDWLEANARGTILPAQQTYYELGGLFAALFAIIVALNWLVPRFWCRYLCPLGAVYAIEAKFAWLKPHSVLECNHCAQCIRVCPTGAIAVSKQGFTVDPTECTLCLDCLVQCPQRAIEFKPGTSAAAVSTPSLTRRQALTSLALGITTVALFRSTPAARRDDTFLIRPPGAQADDFLSKCIRCAECVKVCPTGGLQPSATVQEDLWAPRLVPRLGYCDYSCNACGQICPTSAIPKLALTEKRQQIIGVAYIDQNRCLPWSRDRACIVCEEMCPIPDKAIKLEEVDVVTLDNTTVHLQRPRVQHDLCIGCGICEYQCPLNGLAAIRVYVPTQLPALG